MDHMLQVSLTRKRASTAYACAAGRQGVAVAARRVRQRIVGQEGHGMDIDLADHGLRDGRCRIRSCLAPHTALDVQKARGSQVQRCGIGQNQGWHKDFRACALDGGALA